MSDQPDTATPAPKAEQESRQDPRKVVLRELADKLLSKDDLGREDSFGDIAKLWSAYTGINFAEVDVVNMMILFKAARLFKAPEHIDSLIDIAGYAICGVEKVRGEL